VSFKIIMTTSVSRPCFTKQQTPEVQDQVQDRFFGLRPVLSKDRRSQTTSLDFLLILVNLVTETQKTEANCWVYQ